MTFNQIYDRINGPMYKDLPPPTQYNFLDYVKSVTSGLVNGSEGGSYQLTPLSHEDMGRYGADDVVAHYKKLHAGQSPSRLGKPLNDEEFKKFIGL